MPARCHAAEIREGDWHRRMGDLTVELESLLFAAHLMMSASRKRAT